MLTFRLINLTPAAVAKLRSKLPIAEARAINRSMGSAQTLILRLASQDMGVKVSDLRDKVRTSPATPGNLRARLYASAKRIPVIDFGAKGPEPSRGRGRGVTAKVRRSRNRYPDAFIATMKSGHRGVFRRVPGSQRHGPLPNRAQLPIRELFGPSIWKVFKVHEAAALERGREQLIKNLRSEFRFALAVDAAAA